MQPLATFLAVQGMREHVSWQRPCFNILPSVLSGQKAEDTHLLLSWVIPVLLWPVLPAFFQCIGCFNIPPWGEQLQVLSP